MIGTNLCLLLVSCSLADFHASFHVFCKGIFPADLLYPQCCHEDHIVSSEKNGNDEQINKITSDSFRSVEVDEDSLHLSDVQTQGNCSKYREEGEELKTPDQ
jgi:hypothetical protein